MEFTVLPQLMPFSFGEEPANAGEFTTIACAVIKGDSPITIVWRFNGTETENQNGVSVSQSRRLSTLSIEAVRAEHSGAYTCVAKNAAGAVNHTANLHVNGTIRVLCLVCFCLMLCLL
jgi:hypothetical protein